MGSDILDKAMTCELFAGLDPREGAKVVEFGEPAEYTRGQVIFEESSRSSDLFLLLEGRVSVEIDAPDGVGMADGHLVLALLRDGEVFGELAFLGGGRRSARVSALDTVRVLRFDGAKMFELFESDPRLGYRIMKNLASILAERIVDINYKWRQDRGAAGTGQSDFRM
jgi:CRP/FNR family transcriptional regulator, cyclic AMP receptor protein